MANTCPKCKADNPGTAAFCADCGTQLPSLENLEVTETIETPKEELTTGSTFAGRYQIIEELGKGGMGKVYKVHDTKINEKIALKLIKPEIAKDKKTLERFSNELKFARKIRHKNICQMFDLGEDRGTHFITMEFVEGQDLKKLIRQSGQLAIGTTINITKKVCDGLIEAHSSGVIHRDLKPSNIMIDADGNARIMDFGIARSIEGKGITGAGVMIGTPEYMSPEQVEGKEVDQRSDIYSLGVILYEMVTGKVPFEGDTPFTVGVMHKSEIPQSPIEINPQIPDDLNNVILKCLEKDKENRYQNTGDVRSELESIEKGVPTAERIVPERKPLTSREITVQFSLKKLFIPALIAIAVIIVGIAIWQLFPKKQASFLPPQERQAIAVISFENQTGDTAFDHLRKVIPNLLITNLEQSGYFQVTTWERMYDLLKQLGKEDAEFIDRDLGFELCQMDGVEIIVLGTFGKAADVFATDVKVLDVKTKNLLKSASSTGEGEGSILKTQIDELSKEIIKGIGIPETKVEAQKIQVTNITTSSMEAYNNYIKGRELYLKFYYEDSLPYLEKAVEIDPAFLQAYSTLFYAYGYIGNTQARDETLKKLKTLSHKATERGKLYIDRNYARLIEKDQEKYLKILHQIAEKYPKEKGPQYRLGLYYESRDLEKALEHYNKVLELDPNYSFAHNQIGYLYMNLGNSEKAIEHINKYVSLNPGEANPIDSLAEVFFRMGQLDESIAKYKEALKIKPDFLMSLRNLPYVLALKEDYSEAIQTLDRFINFSASPGNKSRGLLLRAFYYAWTGQLVKSFMDLQNAEEKAQEVGNDSRVAAIKWIRMWIYLERGDLELSRKYSQEWLDFCKTSYPDSIKFYECFHNFDSALIDLKDGKQEAAKSRLIEIENVLSDLTAGQKENISPYIPMLKAEIMLAEGFIQESIDTIENSKPDVFPSLNSTHTLIYYNFRPDKEILSRAYIELGGLDKSIDKHERLITFDPEDKDRRLIHPKYHYRLAMLYEQKGWTGKAIEHYEKFLTLWKDADAGIAEVDDARKRLAGLKGQ